MLKNQNVSLNPKGVDVKIDVTKIVKYSCISGVLIVAIIFASRTFTKFIEYKKEDRC